jgi:hypothetical protein
MGMTSGMTGQDGQRVDDVTGKRLGHDGRHAACRLCRESAVLDRKGRELDETRDGQDDYPAWSAAHGYGRTAR